MIEVMNGKELSNEIQERLKEKCNFLKEREINPNLVVISVGNNDASKVYIRNKKKAAESIGIGFKEIHIDDENLDREQLMVKLLRLISELNSDDSIDGIIVQKPIPKITKEEDQLVNSMIYSSKDVDGFNQINEMKVYEGSNKKGLIPCTPKGVIRLLDEYNIELEGVKVVVIGRSLTVGKPLAMLLLNRNATVTICHSKTKNLKEVTKTADIIISAVGSSKLINHEYIKEDIKCIIDIGMNRDENNKLCGDVDYEDIMEFLLKNGTNEQSYITPVPGGVGPMTVAMLMENTIDAAIKRRGIVGEEM